MRDNADLRPAGAAKVFGIRTLNPAGAGATTRWIEPIHEPVKAIGKYRPRNGLAQAVMSPVSRSSRFAATSRFHFCSAAWLWRHGSARAGTDTGQAHQAAHISAG